MGVLSNSMEVIITPDHITLTNNYQQETNNVAQLKPRPIYHQNARSNATNSELDAKVVVNNTNKLPRLNDNEWDTIIDLIDDRLDREYCHEYQVIKDKLEAYRNEDEIVNRLCDTSISDYSRIPDRY
jgi:hypothetical protein